MERGQGEQQSADPFPIALLNSYELEAWVAHKVASIRAVSKG